VYFSLTIRQSCQPLSGPLTSDVNKNGLSFHASAQCSNAQFRLLPSSSIPIYPFTLFTHTHPTNSTHTTMEGDPSTGTIAGNVTQYEKSCLEVSIIQHSTGIQLMSDQWEVSPGVFQPWPPEGTQDPDWCWLHTATEGGTLVATACLIPQVFRDLLLEATKGTSTLAWVARAGCWSLD
jgi:hypothetical protein